MSLDLFSSNIDDAVNHAARVSAPELPSTFSDNFDDAFTKGRMVSQSFSGTLRRSQARSDYLDEVRTKAGESLPLLAASDAEMNDMIRQIKAKNPAADIAELSDEDLQRRADEIGVRQLADSAALDRRERTTGGSVGSFLGTAAAAVTDPVNLVAFPLAAPSSLGILGTALAWGGIGAGSQVAIEALNAQSMERIQPGYSTSGEPVTNILEAGLGGAVLGGGLKGLSNLWSRAKTGQWPRTVRDAGNVVESEVQITATNPLPGIEGEAAHRTALSKAIDDIANGRPVDVESIVTPELLERSRGLISRLESEQPISLPVINQRAIELAADNQRLGARDAALAADLEKLPAGDASAADRLNRLDAVEQQIEAATDPVALRKLNDRRDQILVDTNPEALQAAAAPIEQRRVMDSERAQIADQLKEITDEHARLQASMLSPMKLPALGQRERIPTGPRGQFEMDLKPPETAAPEPGKIRFYHGTAYEDASGFSGKTFVTPHYDYAKNYHGGDNNVLYTDLTHAEADARGLIDEVNRYPINGSIDDGASVLKPMKAAPAAPFKTPKHQAGDVQALNDQLTPDNIEKMRVDPDLGDTVSRDLDKLMLERPDLEVPTGVTVDAEGRTVPTTRKIESVVAEADARLAAAKEIEACVGPYQSEAAE